MNLYSLGRGENIGSDVVEETLAALPPGGQLRFRFVLEVDKRRHRPLDGSGHLFTATATTADGFNTGRRRYMVACTTCERLLHEATTGPLNFVETHLRNYAIERDGGGQ